MYIPTYIHTMSIILCCVCVCVFSHVIYLARLPKWLSNVVICRSSCTYMYIVRGDLIASYVVQYVVEFLCTYVCLEINIVPPF